MSFIRIFLSLVAVQTFLALAFQNCHAQSANSFKLKLDRSLTDETTATKLTFVQQAVVGRSGELYLLDYGSRSVIRVSAEGKYLGTSGSRGQGPGEFKSVGNIGLTEAGFWVTDPSQRRISVFDKNGTHERTITLLLDPGATDSRQSSNLIGLTASGALISQLHTLFPRDGGAMVMKADSSTLIRHDQMGKLVDTLAVLAPIEGRIVQSRGRSKGKIVASPIQARTIVEFSADGRSYVVIRQPRNADGAFALDVSLVVDGKLRFRRTVPIRGARMTSRIRDDYLLRSGAIRGSEEWAAAELMLASFKELPPAANAFIARDGRVWVQKQAPDSSRRWIILDRSGTLAGVAEVPPRTQIFEADARQVWGVTYDYNDVPGVARFRLVPNP